MTKSKPNNTHNKSQYGAEILCIGSELLLGNILNCNAKWFAEKLKGSLSADKVIVQKSGYFARSAKPNAKDLELIKKSAVCAAEAALNGVSGVAGLDDDLEGKMSVIDFSRIAGGKPFDIDQKWFEDLLINIGQPKGAKASGH